MRKALVGLGIALAAVVILALALFGFFFTDPGERQLGKLLVSSVEQSTGQQVTLDRLHFHGDRVVLHGLKITTADGTPTFAAAEADVDVARSTFFGRGVHLDRVALKDYRLVLKRDAKGEWNLPAAKSDAPKSKGLPDFAIDELALANGAVEVHTGEPVKVEGLGVNGSLAHRKDRFTGDLKVSGQVTSPERVPLTLTATARVEGGAQLARIEASSGNSTLRASVNFPNSGQLDLDIPTFTTAGFAYGPVKVAARLDNGQLQVAQFHLELPGLVADREANRNAAFAAVVQVQDLATATRALEALVGRPLPAAGGRGELHVRVDNPITSAGIAFSGRFPSLGVGAAQTKDLTLAGRIADVRKPAEGSLSVTAAALDVSNTALRSVRLKLERDAKQAKLDATISQPVPATLHLQAKQPRPDKPLTLEQLVLVYPGTTWSAGGSTARIRLLEGGVAIDALELAASGQRIAVKGAWHDTQKNLTVDLSGVRLEALPPELLSSGRPGGQVDGQLKISRPADRLVGAASLALTDGRIEGFSGLSAKLDARLTATRVEGSLTGRALEGRLSGLFDLPLSAGDDAKLSGQLNLESAPIAGAWGFIEGRLSREVAARLQNPSGRLSASVDLTGTRAAPRLTTKLSITDGAVTLETRRYTGITVQAQADATRRQITLSQLLIRTSQGQLDGTGTASRTDQSRPFSYQLKLSAEHFPLPLEDPMLATFKATAQGTFDAELITSKLSFSTLRLDKLPKVTGRRAPASAR